jgi:fructose-specific phosphotransferase system IIC component
MLIPGFFEENVSWEGHLGGLLGGLIAGLVMMWIKDNRETLPERKSVNKKQLNFGRKSEQQTHTYKMDSGTSYVVKERQEEFDKDRLERRRKIGTIVLIAGMVCSVLVIISNVYVGFADYSKLVALNVPYDKAWHANLLWCVIGWIPNVVAHRFLRNSGKIFTILIVIAWILWLFVGPTGIFNPIPQSV